jgi:hypothetical protein
MYGGNRRKDDLAKAHLILSTQAEKQGRKAPTTQRKEERGDLKFPRSSVHYANRSHP